MQELLAQEKSQASSSVNQEVDLDELMDVCSVNFYQRCICICVYDFRILNWKNYMQIELQL